MITTRALGKFYYFTESFGQIMAAVFGRAVDGYSALDDVTVSVGKGEVVALIGENGAGKSTFLKILTGVAAQTTGRWAIDGQKLAILEVGTGFHSDLTGRDNIYRRLRLQGFSRREIRKYEDEIIDFAELEDVIDEPVYTYSSGMLARLAFGIVTCMSAEVLLLDELLAVGDEYFQNKCLKRINQICRSNTTVLFAGHDLAFVQRLCRRALWLEKGRVRELGMAYDVSMHYLGQDATGVDEQLARYFGVIETTEIAEDGDTIEVTLVYRILRSAPTLIFQVVLHDGGFGSLSVFFNSNQAQVNAPAKPGRVTVKLRLKRPPGLVFGLIGAVLFSGNVSLSQRITEDSWGSAHKNCVHFELSRVDDKEGGAYVRKPLKWRRCT